MKIKQALVELLLKYLELKFLHHVLYQPPPPLFFGCHCGLEKCQIFI